MATHGERLRAAFDSRDLQQLVELLDERVVWRGLADGEHGHGDGESPDPGHPGARHHQRPPMCIGREEVRASLERFLASGASGHPIVVDEAGDSVAVDPRPEPTLPLPVHQTFTFRGSRVVLIQDYPDGASARADLAS